MPDERSRGRWKLLLVALIFFGPLALAYGLYFFGDDWQPDGTTAIGELLTPQPLPDALLVADDETARFRSRWSLVQIDDGRCNEACQKSLYESRQVRRSLGKDMNRVQRVFVATDGQPDVAALHRDHPTLVVAEPGSVARNELLRVVGDATPGDLYVVDPAGNLMMRFDAGTAMKDVKKDLLHLLKISRIG